MIKWTGECRDALGIRPLGSPRPRHSLNHQKCMKTLENAANAHLQLEALCCFHGTCSGRRYKPRWLPASRGRQRLRWWRRTLPKRRSPLSRRAFLGACLHKWEHQNSLDATWKTSQRAAGEAQKKETVTWIKTQIHLLCLLISFLVPIDPLLQ